MKIKILDLNLYTKTEEKQGMNSALPLRSELPEELTWDLKTIYASDDQWEEAFKECEKQLAMDDPYAGHVGDSADFLLAAMKNTEILYRPLLSLAIYAHLKHDEDTANNIYTAMKSRSDALVSKARGKLSYLTPEINAIEEDVLQDFYKDCPELDMYKHSLEETRLARAHTLSDKEEALLAKAERSLDAARHVFSIFSNADLTFPEISDENGNKVRLSAGRYGRFLESRTRSVREDAFKGLYSSYGQFRNTFAQLLSGQVNKHNYLSEIRHYKSAREAALFSRNIPEQIYDNLLETVRAHLPLSHRYVELRKRLLALDELHSYDLYVSLSDVDCHFTFEEAKEIVLKALAPLGEDYGKILQKAFAERWIDVMENQGKRSGAYSGGGYDTKPYILLNWQDTLNNLFTLAHELGHSVHSYLSRKNQPFIYSDYGIFLAEIASTTNENLLTHYLLEQEEDPGKRLYYINHYLDGFRATVFRQTQFAEFEHLIHQADQSGIALTADYLSGEYARINRDYYGPALTFDEEIMLEWSRIPHFYYDFYVYQYATGFSAASAFSKLILEDGNTAVRRYLDFLSAGSSDYPLEVLKKAGLDMSVPAPIEAAMLVFAGYLDALEKGLE